MAYTPKDNSGSLFKNDRKEEDRHPDYRGDCIINGQAYWMSAWLKTSDSGRKWMSFSFRLKEAREPVPDKPATKTQEKPRTHAEMKRPNRDDGKSLAQMDDDLPDF